jgi:hypothetical protein
MIAASHTHNGGPMVEAFHSEAAPEYCDMVVRQIAAAVAEAWGKAEECVLIIGSGREDTAAFNRRFRMRDGTERTHPGKMNPDIVDAAGPMDPEVGVIGAFGKASKRFLGCFVNYTCHCTLGVGGAGFSADYPLYLRKTVRSVMESPDAVVVFGNGACGDITQVDNRNPRPWEFGAGWGRLVGARVGAEAAKVLVAVEGHVADAVLACRSTVLDLAPRQPDPETLAKAEKMLLDRTGEKWTNEEIWAREMVLLGQMNRAEPTVKTEIHVLQIGNAALVGVPAEYFCQFGLDIKAQSPCKPTYVVELANGCVGYVPGAREVREKWGYEPSLARSSKLEPEAGAKIAVAAVQTLRG